MALLGMLHPTLPLSTWQWIVRYIRRLPIQLGYIRVPSEANFCHMSTCIRAKSVRLPLPTFHFLCNPASNHILPLHHLVQMFFESHFQSRRRAWTSWSSESTLRIPPITLTSTVWPDQPSSSTTEIQLIGAYTNAHLHSRPKSSAWQKWMQSIGCWSFAINGRETSLTSVLAITHRAPAAPWIDQKAERCQVTAS